MHEECGKCNTIGGLKEEPANLVFIAESELLRQKLKEQLEKMSYEFYDEEDTISLQVSGLKSFFYMFYEANRLSAIESEDVWLVVLSPGERFRSYHVKNARNLSFWLSQVACDEYMEILREKRLTVHFHPIVDRNLSVVGFECLIRGLKQKGLQVSPAYLFECAEKTGSLFYLDRACREIAIQKSAEKGLRETLIFINFVPTSIYNPETCLQTTMKLVDTYNLKRENIVFEVVESHQVRDIKHLRNILDYYREQGFKVALDDVGSGFSGLTNLINLQPDIVKIDRDIVHNVNGDSLRQGVVDALVNMCRQNHIKVLAEGVESIGEFNFLAGRVDYMQGFLFAKPSPEPQRQINLRKS